MNVEKTMEFILAQQATFEENFARSGKRLDRIERLLGQNNRIVSGLARFGVSLRSNVRRHDKTLAESDARMTRVEKNLAEISRTLGALASFRENGRRGER